MAGLLRGSRVVVAAWALLCPGGAWAEARFTGVAAGAMTAQEVILWTRAQDGDGPADVTVQVAADDSFASVLASARGRTVADNNFTLKLPVGGLDSGRRYAYRFVDSAQPAVASPVGHFTTAATPAQAVTVRFGFSGDADGRFRPYPSIATIADRHLDYFVFLGDTIYETESKGSARVPRLKPDADAATLTEALAAYNRKYTENIQGVDASTGSPVAAGQQSLAPMFLTTGFYTLPDNHELGNEALQSGGAPPPLGAARSLPGTPHFDANRTGAYINRTAAFMTLMKAFHNNEPTRVDIGGTPAGGMTVTGPLVHAPEDPRSHGTPRHYFAQSWGPHSVYIQTDNRTYRDARLGADPRQDDLGPRADHPARTMLGATQLAWLKQTLLTAQQTGTTWKFVALSSPIDQVGSLQDGKSWHGGFRAERNELLKHIADNGIDHVVFLSTDDHYTRMTHLHYRTDPTDPGTMRRVPGAFLVVTGPIGAGGPDMVALHNMAVIRTMLAERNASIAADGGPEIGLQGMPGLSGVFREGNPGAAAAPSSVDFYSPDTFAYTVFEIAPNGVLTVQTWGVDSYAANTFRADVAARMIMAFTLDPR